MNLWREMAGAASLVAADVDLIDHARGRISLARFLWFIAARAGAVRGDGATG